MGWHFSDFAENIASSRKVFAYINRIPTVLNDGIMRPEVEGEIEFKNVDFTYPTRPDSTILKVFEARLGRIPHSIFFGFRLNLTDSFAFRIHTYAYFRIPRTKVFVVAHLREFDKHFRIRTSAYFRTS